MSGPINRDDCLRYIENNTFKLRPKTYEQIHPLWPGAVGLELEMLPVFRPSNPSDKIPRLPLWQEQGAASLKTLQKLAELYHWQLDPPVTKQELQSSGARFLVGPGCNISFEPGGQIEFSSRPYPCLNDAVTRLRDIQNILDVAFDKEGVEIVQLGIDPWNKISDIGLQMSKKRYQAMDRHFEAIGPFGRRMMRQTMTIQVNLDFGPTESVLVKRYLAANLLAPVAAAAFSCSPCVDDELTDKIGFRTEVWRHVEPTHCGFPDIERLLNDQKLATCVEIFTDYTLAANIIYQKNNAYKGFESPVPFSKWLENKINDKTVTMEDYEEHLSLMFPEVRPRGFLELRSCDCLPRPAQDIPAMFYCGLLYNDESLDKVLELLSPWANRLHGLMFTASQGLHNQELKTMARQVFEIAQTGYGKLPECFRQEAERKRFSNFCQHYIFEGRVLGDDIADEVKSSGSNSLSWENWRRLSQLWVTNLCQ